MKCYLAAPWFTPQQEAIHDRVLGILDGSIHSVFSPKREIVVKPHDHPDRLTKAFAGNCGAITSADFMVCVTDYKDVGTIWEAGYAYRSNVPIIYYAETLGQGLFNLMLAQSGVMVIRTPHELSRVINNFNSRAQLTAFASKFEGGVE